jgi:splicing factor 3A subunit 1
MNVQEVENMTLAQKRMAAMIMENTADDIEAHRARQAAAEAEAAAEGVEFGGDDGGAMEQSDDEDEASQERKKREEEERAREIERAKALQASSVNTAGPMKIRTDYIPKCELQLFFP